MPQRSLFATVCCPGLNAPPPGTAPAGLSLARLVGRPVQDATGAAIGRIDDVIVPPNGTAATAILALEAGLLAVPLPRLRLDGGRVILAGGLPAPPASASAA